MAVSAVSLNLYVSATHSTLAAGQPGRVEGGFPSLYAFFVAPIFMMSVSSFR